jgi:transcriptional regulator with XRE-family HTH domain
MTPIEALADAMKARGFTQSELAERSGIHHVTICQILHGVRKLGTKTARRLERGLGIKYGSLLNS